MEVHVPADTRADVWNKDRSFELGAARSEDDRERNQNASGKAKEEDPRLSEFRMRSEQIPQRGIPMIGIIHDGETQCKPQWYSCSRLQARYTFIAFMKRTNFDQL